MTKDTFTVKVDHDGHKYKNHQQDDYIKNNLACIYKILGKAN